MKFTSTFVCLAAAAPAAAFTPTRGARSTRVAPARMSESVLDTNTAASTEIAILDSLPLAADYGFDPLGLSKMDLFPASASDKARSPEIVLRDYRDAELRHGRLAMLAALAWPMQELLSPTIARIANREFGEPGLSDILAETAGRSPSVLNGGLEQGALLGFLIGVGAGIGAIDSVSLRIKEEMGNAFVPGDFGFDPLRLLKGASPEAVQDMQAKEINNGRLAMIAVTIFVLEEAITGLPVVQLTPSLFHPLWESQSTWSFLDAAFGVASAAQRIPVEQAVDMLSQ
eukprot:CAMPEP_0182585248 /NCGR_PEP_ID=MMETSP1324-20130603/59886_1 /TAXON_ID=236786 /ORGANISM="Florenciella sp., Strain RCC1587" /LENGTH=285 /DNA_ID=CAMNT_0024802035 /DNA_START=40 /DNA_END=897 /DNA_ORIENTATION=+